MGDTTGVFRPIDPESHGIDYPLFFMLETEVTNAQFKAYLTATGRTKDDSKVATIVAERLAGKRRLSTASVGYSVGDGTGMWRNGTYPAGRGDHPVALVSLHDAQAFCAWLTQTHPSAGLFRLPTWNEWMIAAYGKDRNYPWGMAWEAERTHTSYGMVYRLITLDHEIAENDQIPEQTEPVTARPRGRTPEGIHGMIGNVSEYIMEGDPTSGDYFNLNLVPRRSEWAGVTMSSCSSLQAPPQGGERSAALEGEHGGR